LRRLAAGVRRRQNGRFTGAEVEMAHQFQDDGKVATDQRRRGWLGTLLIGAVAPALLLGIRPARADELSRADAQAVRAVIESQLEAFAADDAERAFSHASAGIRARFGSAGSFMAMVQGAYPMVVRPAATSFFRPESVDDAVLQKVQLRDRAGRLWLAVYQLVRRADRSWAINGCSVIADAGGAST
jgi:hypothetical protein